MKRVCLWLLIGVWGEGCAVLGASELTTLRDYWFDGTAEISSYRLERERYGEMRRGHAILLFVTEPFLPDQQVKAERGQSQARPVLKLNYTENFQTGVYPYSMMLSAFTPFPQRADFKGVAQPFKVSATVHEWCGLVFSQLNRRPEGWQYQGFSYFEQEGDVDVDLPLVSLQDSLFNQIRLSPALLPEGEATLLPSLFYHRLGHQPMRPAEVQFSRSRSRWMKRLVEVYSVRWPQERRRFSIYFEPNFPYKILGWQEWQGDALVSKATWHQTIKSDYWNKNSNQYEGLYRDIVPAW